MFFPVGPAAAAGEMLALGYCLRCPVRVPCRDEARTFHERGVWGGETERERFAAIRALPVRKRLPPPIGH